MSRTEGSNPSLIKTSTGWELIVNGIKVLDIDENGRLRVKGDIQSNELI